ncbi:acyl-CoA dehydrogenase family protein [Streptomyces anthocyanicus]|uniref:acyl-CoA dehydrogenase family protein n=1 Tax=Streptomyces anthocyanicus TaxID=68174 RepID=UPI002DD7B822|nr:acyl-CoA dehydrogenase family protein [Streptomyces anthocyanicus]WSB66482.1 acyl-CoA dehydrogenase family protein [Streptomyces anthocyanicus]
MTAPLREFSRDAVEHAVALAHRDHRVQETHRRLTDDVARAVTDVGFPRHFVPRRFGGRAGTFGELLTAATTLARTCAATAWCATLYAAHGRLASYLPEKAQRELWHSSPDARIAAAIMPPSGEANLEPGGWRLTGRWGFASGVDHADWVLLASWTPGRNLPERHRLFAVPRDELTVTDTWHTLGMRGTGSNTVEADGVLVPRHRTCTLSDLLLPLPGSARCHTVPYAMVGALMFALPVLGAARGALDAWTHAATERQGTAVPPASSTLTRAAARIRAAGLLLEAAAERADHAPVTPLLVAEGQRDAAAAVELCSEAVDQLLRASGSRGQAEDDPVQRHWRDITTAATHRALSIDAAASAYTPALFDRADPSTGVGAAAPGGPAGPPGRTATAPDTERRTA